MTQLRSYTLVLDGVSWSGGVLVKKGDPILTGLPFVGADLTCHGRWFGSPPIVHSYQWRRNGVTISGATSRTFTLTSTDLGTTLDCVVSVTHSSGSDQATSEQSDVIIEPIEEALTFEGEVMSFDGAILTYGA